MRTGGIEISQRVFCLYKYILSHASKEHSVSMKQLQQLYESEGYSSDRRTIYSDILTLEGFNIKLSYDKSAKGYYFVNPHFDSHELRLLVDGIQSMKFITKEEAKKITAKVKELGDVYTQPTLNRSSIVADRIRSMNSAVIKELDTIHEAISTDTQVSFKYAHFAPNKNNPKKYVKNGEALTVSPYAIYWNNGNCYLYAFLSDKNQFRFFRVDRMESIKPCLLTKREGKDNYNERDFSSKPKAKVFNMYQGKQSYDVRMRFHNRLADQVVDEFGRDTMMIPVDDNHFSISVSVSVSPTFYAWVATYGRSVKILGPAEVVEGMKDFLRKSAEMYNEEE